MSPFIKSKLAQLVHLFLLRQNRIVTINDERIGKMGLDYGKYEVNQGIDTKSVSIVIQGPIFTQADFTLQCCKFYRTCYPELEIILSTWRTYSNTLLDNFRALGVKVILSDDPDMPGIYNVNRQIVSTNAGISAVSDSQFVLKTRTDILFNSSTFLETLINNYLAAEKKGYDNRIWITSFNTYLKRPFSFNDQVQFGRIKDLENFWNCSRDPKSSREVDLNKNRNPEEWSLLEIAEVYLVRNYLNNINVNLPLTVEGSLVALRDYFVVFDEAMLGMYWLKTRMRSLQTISRIFEQTAGPCVKQYDWLILQIEKS